MSMIPHSSSGQSPHPEGATPYAVAPTNGQKDSVYEVRASVGELLFYHAQNNEIWAVPKKDVPAFRRESALLDKLVGDYLKAKEAFYKADENYRSALESLTPNPVQLEKTKSTWEKAAKDLEKAQNDFKEEIKAIGKPGGNVIELIPVMQRNGKNIWNAKKLTYIRDSKVKPHWKKFKLGKNKESVIKDGKIDKKKLSNQLSDMKTNVEFKKEVCKSGVLFEQLNQQMMDTCSEWADAFNRGNSHVNVDLEAQAMRYFAGAGCAGAWDPKGGKIGIKGGANTGFMLGEAKAEGTVFFPCKSGLKWTIKGPKSGQEYTITHTRFKAALTLKGYVGVNMSLEVNLGVEYKGANKEKPTVRGYPHKKFRKPGRVDMGQKAQDYHAAIEAETKGQVDLFAGVSVDAELKGALQWWSPEKKDFDDLAAVGPSVALQAGIGAVAMAGITFVEGKFRIVCEAAACLGMGAKGKLELEVNAEQTYKFMYFMAHNLYCVGYEHYEIIQTEAFQAWQYLCFEAVRRGKSIEDAIKQFGGEIEESIYTFLKKIELALEKEDNRTTLMREILNDRTLLKIAPPETKGMLLYQLTRHGTLSNANPMNYDWRTLDPTQAEWMPLRKEAVMKVLRWVQNKREFDNVVQHIHPTGEKGDLHANKAMLERFIHHGGDPRHRWEAIMGGYEKLIARLEAETNITPWSDLVSNDSHAFMARDFTSPEGPFKLREEMSYV